MLPFFLDAIIVGAAITFVLSLLYGLVDFFRACVLIWESTYDNLDSEAQDDPEQDSDCDLRSYLEDAIRRTQNDCDAVAPLAESADLGKRNE